MGQGVGKKNRLTMEDTDKRARTGEERRAQMRHCIYVAPVTVVQRDLQRPALFDIVVHAGEQAL